MFFFFGRNFRQKQFKKMAATSPKGKNKFKLNFEHIEI